MYNMYYALSTVHCSYNDRTQAIIIKHTHVLLNKRQISGFD